MKCAYHPAYHVALPPGHPFPMSKYPLLRTQLLLEGIITPSDLMQPEALDTETLGIVHTPEYLAKLQSSSLSAVEIRRLGVPWSEELWLRSRVAAGGTLLAARTALRDGMAANLAGGTHHAFADHGEGFHALANAEQRVRFPTAPKACSRARLRRERGPSARHRSRC